MDEDARPDHRGVGGLLDRMEGLDRKRRQEPPKDAAAPEEPEADGARKRRRKDLDLDSVWS